MHHTLFSILALSLFVGCGGDESDSDTDVTYDDTGEVEQATICDFSSIAGTWVGTIPSGRNQSLTLETQSDFDASIGINVFSTDDGIETCTFDVQCKPSAAEGTFLVFNEKLAGGICTEGWYTMAITDSVLAVDFHLTETGDPASSYELTKE